MFWNKKTAARQRIPHTLSTELHLAGFCKLELRNRVCIINPFKDILCAHFDVIARKNQAQIRQNFANSAVNSITIYI